MKMKTHEDGLVTQYLNELSALAVKASNGEDVSAQVDLVVQKAADHFKVITGSTELGNLQAFVGGLTLRIEVSHASQPLFRTTLENAKHLVDEIIQKRGRAADTTR